jgi:hypothetical protein
LHAAQTNFLAKFIVERQHPGGAQMFRMAA